MRTKENNELDLDLLFAIPQCLGTRQADGHHRRIQVLVPTVFASLYLRKESLGSFSLLFSSPIFDNNKWRTVLLGVFLKRLPFWVFCQLALKRLADGAETTLRFFGGKKYFKFKSQILKSQVCVFGFIHTQFDCTCACACGLWPHMC